MTLKEFIEQLEALDVDPETKVWVMDTGIRMSPEIFTHKRLGVVVM